MPEKPVCEANDIELIDPVPVTFYGINSAPGHNRARAKFVLKTWESHCPGATIQDIARSRYDNYICLIPGKRDDKVVVGAHYDKVGEGKGIADNWSGVMITSQLIEYFVHNQPEYTLEFVAFAEEERGMVGSSAYLQALLRKIEKESLVAMINIDTIGLKPVVIDEHSTAGLGCLARNTARALQIEFSQSSWDAITGDWEPFAKQNIPVLNLHSVDARTIKRIHSRRDKSGNVDEDLMQDAYHLVLNVILKLPEMSTSG
ncbi:MAG: M28 family peptidase [bacterium]|nr:Zn-dependent exopeptidase M28 [Gammaproteobacteria bacterium]HIL96183.1 Zn-dependent exopeptidase M28 [Pseudomonadales bacterium]